MTNNEVIECPVGFYSHYNQTFYVVKEIEGIQPAAAYPNRLSIIKDHAIRDYEILTTFTPQDLADSLSTYHKEKFNADKRDFN